MMASDSSQSENTPPFWPLVLPFAVFMLVSMLEPQFADDNPSSGAALEATDPVAWRYLLIYSVKIVLMLGITVFFFNFYTRFFKFKVTLQGLAFGILGGVIWIGLCYLQLEKNVGTAIGLPEAWFDIRTAINPSNHFTAPWPLVLFFVIRFTGLVVAVPLAEEIFLRGFLIRFLEDPDWWKVKIKHLGLWPLAAATLYGVLTHPTEAIAAIAWFSWITLLMIRTKSIWDCVVAHAITNLMLGIYVVMYAKWHLW